MYWLILWNILKGHFCKASIGARLIGTLKLIIENKLGGQMAELWQATSYELWKEFWPEFTIVEFIAAHTNCTVILDKSGHFYTEQTIQHKCVHF